MVATIIIWAVVTTTNSYQWQVTTITDYRFLSTYFRVVKL